MRRLICLHTDFFDVSKYISVKCFNFSLEMELINRALTQCNFYRSFSTHDPNLTCNLYITHLKRVVSLDFLFRTTRFVSHSFQNWRLTSQTKTILRRVTTNYDDNIAWYTGTLLWVVGIKWVSGPAHEWKMNGWLWLKWRIILIICSCFNFC